jgi:hypothetical protein
MNFVNDITLEFLMNKKLFDRMGLKSKQNTVERKERRIYRKRIIALTCELLLNKDDKFQIENEDIVNSFRQYTKNCIQFFKASDENDLYQKELGPINEEVFEEEEEAINEEVFEEGEIINEKVFKEEGETKKEVKMLTADYVKIDTMKLNASLDFYLENKI